MVYLLLPGLTCKKRMHSSCTGEPSVEVGMSHRLTFLSRDPRNPVARLRSHGSTHSDDITAVHFLKNEDPSSSSKVLLSASSDGLVSTSNALEADEDEAVLHVGNWGCSISQAGWISNAHGTGIWAASDMETFSCWSNEVGPLYRVNNRNNILIMYSWTNFWLLIFAAPPCMTTDIRGLLIILSRDIRHGK